MLVMLVAVGFGDTLSLKLTKFPHDDKSVGSSLLSNCHGAQCVMFVLIRYSNDSTTNFAATVMDNITT